MRHLVGIVIASLLMACGGGAEAAVPPTFPTSWGVTKYASNPVISTTNNASESLEQYSPAPVQMPNGDIWVYVKGQRDIYGWKSTDDGVTFTLEGAVIQNDGSWDSQFALEPAVIVEGTTIHLWYKGTDVAAANADWAWGYATASTTDPTSFTKYASNPILTSATVSTALGGASVADLAVSDVVKVDGTFHFYGYALYDGRYQLIHASGSTYTNPSGVESILLADTDNDVVQNPSVFKYPGGQYGMFYAEGAISVSPDSRVVKVAKSLTGTGGWTFDVATVLTSTQAWEDDRVHTASLLRDGVGPDPIIDGSDRWKLYYSGQDGGVADTGLAYLSPS